MVDAYPRPDFQRVPLRWESLDGTWDFLFDDADAGRERAWHEQGLPVDAVERDTDGTVAPTSTRRREILVPFAFQTPASGIGLYEAHEVMWYERRITDLRTLMSALAGTVCYCGTVQWIMNAQFGSTDEL